jgi:23S rRNA (pseudouridine1915-N3)-methyltransferase
LLVVGKTDEIPLSELINMFEKRIKSFVSFDLKILPGIKNTKNLSGKEQKSKEGQLILSKLNPSDRVILLDEKGKEMTSVEFAGFLQKNMNSGIKNLVFIIGGPYGFSQAVYQRAQQKISLSQMTFSHQLIRLIFLEQLYRAFTIIHHHPYHNE